MSEHVVKQYDQELKRLSDAVFQMGSLAARQIQGALLALAKGDWDLAQSICDWDDKIDSLERDVDDYTIRLLALRQPVADDLRGIVAALRTSIDLERVADCAANVARRAALLLEPVPPEILGDLQEMARTLEQMLRDSLTAYRQRDLPLALQVWKRDDEVDTVYLRVLQRLRERMVSHPESVDACTHLLFAAKNLERIGDHLTNICEHVHFLVSGKPIERGAAQGA